MITKRTLAPKIWLSSPHIGKKEIEFVKDAFDTNWIAPLGPHVDQFENDLSDYIGAKYTAVLSSGTAAIHLALILLDVKSGDEVICQSFTFSASANPIIYQGATPIFIDSEEETWNIDPNLLELAINDRMKNGKKPKAIIPVHLYGMPAKMDELIAISNKYEIPIIEDAAEAIGSEYKNKKAGSLGMLGVLSFNGNKIITTSAGGALLSNNKDYIEKAKFFATQARDPAPHYQHSYIGYNYRMSNVLAGIGRGQLKVLNERVEQRRNNFEFYKNQFSVINGFSFQPELKESFSNRWLTTLTIDPNLTNGIAREDIRLALEKENIESRPLWKPMHLQPVFKDAPQYINGISDKLFENGLCLPSGSNLSIADKERIVNIINDTLNESTPKRFILG